MALHHEDLLQTDGNRYQKFAVKIHKSNGKAVYSDHRTDRRWRAKPEKVDKKQRRAQGQTRPTHATHHSRNLAGIDRSVAAQARPAANEQTLRAHNPGSRLPAKPKTQQVSTAHNTGPYREKLAFSEQQKTRRQRIARNQAIFPGVRGSKDLV